MGYLVRSKVKQFFHDRGRQISPDGERSIELKLVEFLEKIESKCRGHKWRVDATIVNVTNI